MMTKTNEGATVVSLNTSKPVSVWFCGLANRWIVSVAGEVAGYAPTREAALALARIVQ